MGGCQEPHNSPPPHPGVSTPASPSRKIGRLEQRGSAAHLRNFTFRDRPTEDCPSEQTAGNPQESAGEEGLAPEQRLIRNNFLNDVCISNTSLAADRSKSRVGSPVHGEGLGGRHRQHPRSSQIPDVEAQIPAEAGLQIDSLAGLLGPFSDIHTVRKSESRAGVDHCQN